jgi:hypothetical protein
MVSHFFVTIMEKSNACSTQILNNFFFFFFLKKMLDTQSVYILCTTSITLSRIYESFVTS